MMLLRQSATWLLQRWCFHQRSIVYTNLTNDSYSRRLHRLDKDLVSCWKSSLSACKHHNHLYKQNWKSISVAIFLCRSYSLQLGDSRRCEFSYMSCEILCRGVPALLNALTDYTCSQQMDNLCSLLSQK
jgi:hypothetical protein